MKKRAASYLFTNATVLDGTARMAPLAGRAVAVEDGAIVSVASASDVRTGPHVRVIDLHGGYLLPGLINMHVHLCGSGAPMSAEDAGELMGKLDNPLGAAVLRRIIRRHAQTQLASGVTTLRGAGDPLFADVAVRDGIEAGRFFGPRLIVAGPGITVPGGHGDGLFAQAVRSAEEAESLVRDLFARGVDVIKLFVTGGVLDAVEPGEPGALRMPPEIVAAACKSAHRFGLPVMAHIESTEGIRVALEAGVDTVEHGAQLTPDITALFRRRGGAQLSGRAPSLTCTISPSLPAVRLPGTQTRATAAQRADAEIVCRGIIRCAREALAAQIPVGLGTDSSCPCVTHYDMWREIAHFVRHVGVTPAFALHTATQVNARLLGIDNETGTIETGKAADLIVVRRNPLEDIRALRHVDQVMVRGRLIARPRVRRIRELDSALDQIMGDTIDMKGLAGAKDRSGETLS